MSTHWRCWLGFLLFCALAGRVWAGGSGLNVVIVVNQNSTNSVQLGNYYREQRQVPPQNVLRINWAGGNVSWTLSDFTTYLYNPLLTLLSGRQLTNQIDYVLLSMDIPYRVTTSSSTARNSTTSTLFYGFKPDVYPPNTCSLTAGSTSLYAGSEGVFRSTPPIHSSSNAYLATMITASNLPLAKMVVDGGVAGDFTSPPQTAYLVKSSDVARNVRYPTFDNAVFDTRLRDNYSLVRTNSDSDDIFGNCFGLQSSWRWPAVAPTTFVPGSLTDNLTSFGGFIFEPTDHLNILVLLAQGAAGSYGPVDEPCNYLEKFPSPQNYFYQARGFGLGECYYLSVTNPYQGLVMGDPLSAPFAQPAAGAWLALPANALLSGTTNLSCQFTASDSTRPIQQVDLFLDGLWLQTLTNIAPAPNNVLSVQLNGYTTNYTVPAGATLLSVASNLTARLNAESSQTHVSATAHGDRIELQSTDASLPGSLVSLSVSNSTGTAAAATTFLRASGTSFLDTVAFGLHNLTVMPNVVYPPPVGSWLLLSFTKTNGALVQVGSTNNGTTLTTIALMVADLANQVNADSQLTGADGCVAQDYIDYSQFDPNNHGTEFNLVARSAGWNASQLQATLSGSAAFAIFPAGPSRLQDNLGDLRPRAHLYVTAGTTNLPLTFALNTSTLPNGYHELTAVAYEGSHVRTQKRITQSVLIQNGPLSATFTTPYASSNVAVEASLPFTVVANSGSVSKIELFSTGGALTNVTGQSNATFAIAGTNLDLGLHPFYAMVTTSAGEQYRTDTKSIRLVGPDAPFSVSITAPPPTLSWPATAGRSYDLLATTNLTNAFQTRATVVPTNSPACWADTNGSRGYYRVRTSQ